MLESQSSPALQFERLRFAWPGQSSPCLDIPGFDVRRGERIFLYGPSGSGKSTLLSLVGGVAVPQHGDVRVLGTSLPGLSRAARDRFRGDHVGFIFQQFNLIPCLSALQNVLLPAGFSKRRGQRAEARGGSVRAEAERLLRTLDLAPDWWHRPTTELSVGQQQRVAAARALLGSPELLIADEPTSALDAVRCEAFLQLLLQECAQAGTCVLFVSHDERLAPHFTRRVSLPEINRVGGETATARPVSAAQASGFPAGTQS